MESTNVELKLIYKAVSVSAQLGWLVTKADVLECTAEECLGLLLLARLETEVKIDQHINESFSC